MGSSSVAGVHKRNDEGGRGKESFDCIVDSRSKVALFEGGLSTLVRPVILGGVLNAENFVSTL